MFLRIDLEEGRGSGESLDLRLALDDLLALNKCRSINTVATTIFPELLWTMANGDRHAFFKTYLRDYPRFKALDRQNARGTYFGRMIEPVNRVPEGQLEHVIRIQENHPTAARIRFQISIFDPNRDHKVGALPGFPCMQQLSFARHDDSLEVNAFYASQLVFEKGYGNYLGLVNLGIFAAKQMRLTLRAVNVFAGIAKTNVSNRRSKEYQRLIQVAEDLCSLKEQLG